MNSIADYFASKPLHSLDAQVVNMKTPLINAMLHHYACTLTNPIKLFSIKLYLFNICPVYGFS